MESTEKEERVYFRTGDAVSEVEILLDEDLGGASMDDAVLAWTERSYKRRKGDKIVSRILSGGMGARYSPDDALWANYDYLIAIDTNYREVHGRVCAVSGVIGCYRVFVGGPDGALKPAATGRYLPALGFADPQFSPEKLGWEIALDQLADAGALRRYSRLAVIVDAHLSELEQLNSRETALREDKRLPHGVTLVYASSDTGGDDLPNSLIRRADRYAAKWLRELERRPTIIRSLRTEAYPCTGVTRLIGKNVSRFEDA
jgi:hypothetical protein